MDFTVLIVGLLIGIEIPLILRNVCSARRVGKMNLPYSIVKNRLLYIPVYVTFISEIFC